jgi:hypothetical protein
MPCPDHSAHCNSPGSIQLCLVTDEQKQLTAKAAPYGRLARRCVRCGLVYVRAAGPHRLGWLDGIKGPGFHPAGDYT